MIYRIKCVREIFGTLNNCRVVKQGLSPSITLNPFSHKLLLPEAFRILLNLKIHEIERHNRTSAVPNSFWPNFGKFLKTHLAAKRFSGLGAGVIWPPAGQG